MDEAQFWHLIEESWKAVGGRTKERQKLANGKLSEAQAEQLLDDLDEVVASLEAILEGLPAVDLQLFDQILERKLYDIDRQEIQECTDGSDDGFLYARGFIVAAGKQYYDAVNGQPDISMTDVECEQICYLPMHIYERKFGKMPASGISRESCSNTDAWD